MTQGEGQDEQNRGGVSHRPCGRRNNISRRGQASESPSFANRYFLFVVAKRLNDRQKFFVIDEPTVMLQFVRVDGLPQFPGFGGKIRV